MRKITLSFKLILLGLIQSTILLAQPANDNCSGAITLTVSPNAGACITTSVNTLNATQSTGTITCASTSQDDDVWYKFTAISTTTIFKISNSVNNNGSSTAWKPGFVVYSGSSCTGLTQLSCNANTANSNDTAMVNGLVIGQTYYLRTFLGGAPNSGSFNLCLYAGVPVNDNCANAIEVTTATSSLTCSSNSKHGTTLNGTSSTTPKGSCGATNGDDDEVWYKFKIWNTKSTVMVDPSGNMDAVVELYSGTCGSLSYVKCKDDPSAPATEYLNATGLTLGAYYYVRVFSYSSASSAMGEFDICAFDNPNIGVGIETVEFARTTMYPNPAKGSVSFSELPSNGTLITISNANGQVIMQNMVETTSYTLDISTIPQGIYFVQLNNQKENIVTKLVVE